MPTDLSMHRHMLRLAWLTAMGLSKDPDTKTGAIITTWDFRQMSLGYNGFPRGVPEGYGRWRKPEKYHWVVHAEENALLNAPFDTYKCLLFCNVQPCEHCMGRLINAGISEIYYSIEYKTMNEDPERVKRWDALATQFYMVKQLAPQSDGKFIADLQRHF